MKEQLFVGPNRWVEFEAWIKELQEKESYEEILMIEADPRWLRKECTLVIHYQEKIT